MVPSGPASKTVGLTVCGCHPSPLLLELQLTASHSQTHALNIALHQAVCVGKAGVVLEAAWSYKALQKGEQWYPRQGTSDEGIQAFLWPAATPYVPLPLMPLR